MTTTIPTPEIQDNSSELERAELAMVAKYAAPDRYISEQEMPWFPWVGPIEIKLMRADNRTGQMVVGLRAAEDCVLGKHRHRGTVTAVTLRGRWEYFEYDWVATPGDYVRENPGTIHTLHIFENTEILFTVEGTIEFLNEDNTLSQAMDLWSFVHLYNEYCKATDQQFNERIFY